MIRISLMAKRIFSPHRRQVLAGSVAAALTPFFGRAALAQPSPSLRLQAALQAKLQARLGTLALRPGQAETPVSQLAAPDTPLRFRRGASLEITFQNGLPRPTLPDWRGIDGAAAIEPLTARAPIP